MHEISQEIMARYQVRKTRAQKEAFRAFFRERMTAEGHAVREEKTSAFSGTNIIIGDLDSAECICTAHYDTCAVMPVPNFMAPKNILASLLYQVLLVVVMFAVAIGLGWLAERLSGGELGVGLIVYGLALLAMMALLLCGPPNKHTANDNTSGVIVLAEALCALPEADRARVAFVLFDNEEMGLLGSSAFRKAHRERTAEAPVINFDCVGDGDHLLLVANKRMRRDAAWMARVEGALDLPEGKTSEIAPAIRTLYPSDQINFPKNIGVVALKRAPVIGYYLDRIHTPKDTRLDAANIEALRTFVLTLARSG